MHYCFYGTSYAVITLSVPFKLIDTAGKSTTDGGTWEDKNHAENAFDGNVNTMFDGNSGGWAQIDLGEATPIAAIGFIPRPDYPGRMVNTVFYGSNDGSQWTELCKVTERPPVYQETRAVFDEMQSWRYIKYQNGSDYCNVNEIYLYTLDAPEIPVLTPALGWDGSDFTIDFVAEAVTPIDGAEYGVTVTSADGKTFEAVYDPAAEDGVGMNTPNTNLTYTAVPTVTVAGVVFKGAETAKEAIYSLVMQAVADSTLTGKINAAQLAKVHEVLKNGGVFLGEDGSLTKETALVMTKKDNVITLTEKAVKLGLAFTDGMSSNKYNKLTVNADGTVTLSDEATGQLAEVLSLDAVNLEFVPTEISETDGSGADADLDFTPEL